MWDRANPMARINMWFSIKKREVGRDKRSNREVRKLDGVIKR